MEKDMNKKVSIIIPLYNSKKYIKECLESVINQTYKNLEIIIIDDCSNDGSLEIVNEYNDTRINIIKLSNRQGVSVARNKGIEYATGDYLCFIDSDDVWVKDKIEKQVRFIEENDYAFIYSNYVFIKDEDYDISKCKVTNAPKYLTYEMAIKDTTIFISTVMLNMKKIKKEYVYMENLKIGQDTLAWWNILKKGITAYGMEEALAYYRVHYNSLSSNKINAVIGAWKIYLLQDIGMVKRIYCYCSYLKNAIKRRI